MRRIEGIFEPITYGIEWETMLADKKLMPLKDDILEKIISNTRKKLPWSETGFDIITRTFEKIIEFRTGILNDFQQFSKRIKKYFSVIQEETEKENAVFFPIGSPPHIGAAVGLHIHIGSIYSLSGAADLANRIVRYTPIFGAICANSPFWGFSEKSGKYKSYRIKNLCDFCSIPWSISEPAFTRETWGTDICPKVFIKPTIELRICDSPCFVEFISEIIPFIVGFILSVSIEKDPVPTRDEYIQYLINRWCCARYGLQAKILWKDNIIDVTEVANEMLKRSISTLKHLKFELPEFKILPMMFEKKLTQADMQIDLYMDNLDLHSFSCYLSNIIKLENIFTKWLKNTQTKESVDIDDVDEFILSNIKRNTPYYHLSEILGAPLGIMEEYISKFIKQGKVKVEKSPPAGITYSRVK
jgi:gamma-glutamyl:cysteine ligase YbdK (ATP-grasp superfamily)